MTETKSFTKRAIWMLLILVVAGSVIYELPYIRYNYYDSMMLALGLDDLKMGNMMSLYGIVAMLCYFPGGWLADRISSRILMTFSLITSGVLGFWFATFPSYNVCLLIHFLWGITTTLTFWSAMIRATRKLAESGTQGRFFGLLESGRGLLPLLYGFAILAVFTAMTKTATPENSIQAVRWVFILYSALCIIGGVLTLFFEAEKPGELQTKRSVLKDISHVIRIPAVWLIALIIFSSYTLYIGLGYLTPYLTDHFGVSESLAAGIGLIRTYGIPVLVGAFAGFLADKIGSNFKVMIVVFGVAALSMIAFLLIPGNPSFLMMLVVAMIVLAVCVFVTRGIYFAAIDEVRIAPEFTGAAVGFASFIGFIPEAFAYTLIGNWLDKYPGITGYKMTFGYMCATSILGFAICAIMIVYLKKQRLSQQQTSEHAICM